MITTLPEKQLNVKIPPDLDKELELYCSKNDKHKKDVVKTALEDYLSKKPQAEN